MDLLSAPGRTYRHLDAGLRRTYNQAWFSWIYVDALTDDPTDGLSVAGQHTGSADSLDASRSLVLAKYETSEAGPEDPLHSSISVRITRRVRLRTLWWT